jgi:hypothetical protein
VGLVVLVLAWVACSFLLAVLIVFALFLLIATWA